MDARPAITRYRLHGRPYCERVVRTLDRLGLDYESRFVEPMRVRRNAEARLTGERSVPAIVDRGTGVTMSERAPIVDHLEAAHGGA